MEQAGGRAPSLTRILRVSKQRSLGTAWRPYVVHEIHVLNIVYIDSSGAMEGRDETILGGDTEVLHVYRHWWLACPRGQCPVGGRCVEKAS